MKERPILFSGEMVRAILAGKTQTRRVVKPTMTPPRVARFAWSRGLSMASGGRTTTARRAGWFHPDYPGDAQWFTCYGQPWRSAVWVRETFTVITGDISGKVATSLDAVEYRADGSAVGDVITSAARGVLASLCRAPIRASRRLKSSACAASARQRDQQADAQAEGADQEFRTVVYSPTGVKGLSTCP